MCRGFIHHRFPDGILLAGAIALENNSSGYRFFQVTDGNDLQIMQQRLFESNAVKVFLFEGDKAQLITRIKRLNKEAGLPGYDPVLEYKNMIAA